VAAGVVRWGGVVGGLGSLKPRRKDTRKKLKCRGMTIVLIIVKGLGERRRRLLSSGRPVFESPLDEVLTLSLESRLKLWPSRDVEVVRLFGDGALRGQQC
jgi:hypothetical protein